ncbi:glucose dehydrogenase [Nephila pilipes]|uniref:Glucose dehydrogenase n=1 Tax=Nephila pilipes TaxID=299642 RepID=A0A8X6NQ44_NEPPI|nr:glucose dehydrogenase [Nephila pilipes]
MDLAVERSYPTPYANASILPLLLLSLGMQQNVPKQADVIREEYDYIIVGAGSAGSVVANRLSEEPCVSVLLLEAGGKPPMINDIPALARTFFFTDLDWAYKTVPQKHTGRALIKRQVIWPSGKGLGGSSLMNAMLYIRGNRKNYDNWAAQGATGWSYEDVFPYFLKLEDNRDPEFLGNGFHASGGPLTVEKPGYESEIKGPILEAAEQFGYEILDSNGAKQTGFSKIQGTLRNGQRCSAAKSYLVPAENRTNLDILGNAHVRKVLTENGRATGVMFDYQQVTYNIRAKREVILSAGTTNTPQLLMLSGIGPKKHLEKFQIPLVADLPVGNNFHDHAAGIIPYTIGSQIPTVMQKLINPENVEEYITNKTGPLSSMEFISNVAFLKDQAVLPSVDFPDYQLFFVEIPKEVPKYQVGFKPEVYQKVFGPYEDGPMMICVSQPTQPRSRGTVRLKSSNPYDPPAIDPNYFADPRDIRDMVQGKSFVINSIFYHPITK